jgi:hypothetical protein
MSSIVGSHQQVCHLLSVFPDGSHSHHSLSYEAAEFLNGHYHPADHMGCPFGTDNRARSNRCPVVCQQCLSAEPVRSWQSVLLLWTPRSLVAYQSSFSNIFHVQILN